MTDHSHCCFVIKQASAFLVLLMEHDTISVMEQKSVLEKSSSG